MTVNMTVEINGKGTIFVGGEEVGFIKVNGNTILQVEVKERAQNEGIATKAVGIITEQLKGSEYKEIKCGTVVSPAMQRVLQKNDFKSRVETDISGREKIVWFKQL